MSGFGAAYSTQFHGTCFHDNLFSGSNSSVQMDLLRQKIVAAVLRIKKNTEKCRSN